MSNMKTRMFLLALARIGRGVSGQQIFPASIGLALDWFAIRSGCSDCCLGGASTRGHLLDSASGMPAVRNIQVEPVLSSVMAGFEAG